MTNKLRVAIIGCGRQNIEDHLPAVLKSKKVQLDSIFDIDTVKGDQLSQTFNIPFYSNLGTLLSERQIDIAIIAVPHNEYLPIIKQLAAAKIHILKEKPFAINLEEASQIKKIVEINNIKMMITLQRRFNPIYKSFNQLADQIGTIYNIDARYTLNINRLDEGWRSQKLIAGGGALLDMGYHIVDLLIWYFGLPDKISNINGYLNKPDQVYDVEDSSKTLFEYAKNNKSIMGSMFISRIYPEKSEQLIVSGTDGVILLKKGHIERQDLNGNVIESLTRFGSWPSAAIEQIEYFADIIIQNKPENPFLDHFLHQAFIEACYISSKEFTTIAPLNLLNQ